MLEPTGVRLRPIAMVRTLCLFAAALLLLTGCGSNGRPDSNSGTESTGSPTGSQGTSPSATPSGSSGPCAAASSSDGSTSVEGLATVDMSGDGTPDQVGISTVEGCPPALVVDLGSAGAVSALLPDRQPAVREAFGVDLPGRQGSLLVTRQDHPRGGFQLRVFGLADNELTELEVDNGSLVPFVALDVREHPWSIDCADGGVVFTEAVTHQPAGVTFAWDIRRTTYAVDGNEVKAGPTSEIADKVRQKQLTRKYPDLVRHIAFTSCRAAG